MMSCFLQRLREERRRAEQERRRKEEKRKRDAERKKKLDAEKAKKKREASTIYSETIVSIPKRCTLGNMSRHRTRASLILSLGQWYARYHFEVCRKMWWFWTRCPAVTPSTHHTCIAWIRVLSKLLESPLLSVPTSICMCIYITKWKKLIMEFSCSLSQSLIL